jgi:hypothetical protein
MQNREEIPRVWHGHAEDHHGGWFTVGLYRSKKPTRAEALSVQQADMVIPLAGMTDRSCPYT